MECVNKYMGTESQLIITKVYAMTEILKMRMAVPPNVWFRFSTDVKTVVFPPHLLAITSVEKLH